MLKPDAKTLREAFERSPHRTDALKSLVYPERHGTEAQEVIPMPQSRWVDFDMEDDG